MRRPTVTRPKRSPSAEIVFNYILKVNSKMISINIQSSDNVSPFIRDNIAKLEHTRPLMQLLGEDLAKSLRAHFALRDAQPNAHRWTKRHFWLHEGRRNTALASFSDNEAVVSIASEAIAHKLHGGEVRPKRGRALAIPACNEAYRAGQPSAMNKDMLEFVPLKLGGLVGMLIERQHDVIRRTKQGFKQGQKRGGKIWFWLMAKVTHRPDPQTLPPQADLDMQANALVENYLRENLEQ